jgi:hypothetical protein
MAVSPAWLAPALSLENPVLIWACYALSAAFFVVAWLALFWHHVKRWRPFTFAPADSSAATQEFFTPQKEVGGVRGSRYYQNEPIYMPDILRELAAGTHKGKGPVLQRLTFEDCQIHGPAMLKPVPGDTNPPWFQHCEWEEDLDAFYLEDPRRTTTGDIGKEIGLIGLQDCVFRDCYFKGVGVVLTQVGYDIAKEQYEIPGTTTISL